MVNLMVDAVSRRGSPTEATWASVQLLCGDVVNLAGRGALLQADCRITGRFVRKLSGMLYSLQEENNHHAFADIDSSGLLLSTLQSTLDLMARCQLAGRIEAYLETAALRMEFKTFAADLRAGLERLDTENMLVPNDVVDDILGLRRQLAQLEFTVAASREASALELHQAVLLERTGLQHDKHIMALLQDVIDQCGLSEATAPELLFEARSLRRRAAESHTLQDHVHELVLYKVAEVLERDILPTAPLPQSPTPASASPCIPRTPYAEPDDDNACHPLPPLPSCGAHSYTASTTSGDSRLPPLPSASSRQQSAQSPSSLTCPSASSLTHATIHKRPSLVRRKSFTIPPPPATCAFSAAVVIGGSHPKQAPAVHELKNDGCNEVMLRSTSSHSLLSSGAPRSVYGFSSVENSPSTCQCLSAMEEGEVDPEDITTIAQALASENCVTLEVAATCLLHQGCENVNWDALCGARMRLIRPLINILRYKHPLSLKVTVASLLRMLARDKDNRKLICESGGLLMLLRLLRNPSDPAKQAAARAITNIAYGNTAVKGELINAGILELLNEMMEGLHPGNQEAAALAAANLACSADSAQSLTKSGTLTVCVSVLRDGTNRARQAAARALRNILHHHPDAKAAAVELGAVPLLLDLMSSEEGGCRHASIMALGCMAANNDKIKDAVTFDGALEVLVAQLNDTDVAIQEAAASTLATMCTSHSARMNIAKAGGIAALVALLRCKAAAGKASEQLKGLRTAAALALRALVACENSGIKQAVAEAGAIPLLTGILSGLDGDVAQKAAVGALWNLAYKNEANRNIIRECGAIVHLIRMLKSYQPESTRREAARAISNLSCNNPTNQLAIAAAGAIAPLVHLLQSGSPCSVEAAARALSNLALQDSNQTSIAEAGAVGALLQVVAHGPDTCQEAAVRAYGNVIVNNHHDAVLTTAPQAIPLLKNLLRRDGKRVMQLEACRALGNLACLGGSVQDDIVSHGVLVDLIKMLDSGHDGTRESAACTLWDVAYDNDRSRRAIVTANGVPYLVQALLFGGSSTKEAAASTLLELACVGCKQHGQQPASGSTSDSGDSPLQPTLSVKRSASRQISVQVDRGSDDGDSVRPSSASTSKPAHSCGQSVGHLTLPDQSWSAIGALTASRVRACIIEAGAMPLFIQMACSTDAKLHAVGIRALEVMGFSPDSEEVQRAAFPQLSAYHQPQLMQSQPLATHL